MIGLNIVYVMCAKNGCDFFVDPNDAHQGERDIAPYIHLEDGNLDPDGDHEAVPSDMQLTLAEWSKIAPELFHSFPDGHIGPNSRFYVPGAKRAYERFTS